MTVKKILTAPDPFLKQISKPVDEVTKEIQDLMDDMLDTMYDAPGIGLAAVQIGVPLRVIVMDISWRNEEGIKEPLYFVNPEITVKTKNLSTYEEGCLSVPDQYAEIDRPEECEINFGPNSLVMCHTANKLYTRRFAADEDNRQAPYSVTVAGPATIRRRDTPYKNET